MGCNCGGVRTVGSEVGEVLMVKRLGFGVVRTVGVWKGEEVEMFRGAEEGISEGQERLGVQLLVARDES